VARAPQGVRGDADLRAEGPGGGRFALLTPPGRGGIAVIRCTGPGTAAALAACFRPAVRGRGAEGAGPAAGEVGRHEGPGPSAAAGDRGERVARRSSASRPSAGGAAPPADRTEAEGAVAQRDENPACPSASAVLPPPGRLAYGHVVDAAGRALDEVILYHVAPGTGGVGPGLFGPARRPGETFEVNCHGGPAAVEAVCGRLAELGLARTSAERLLAAEGAGPLARTVARLLEEAQAPLAARVLVDQAGGALRAALGTVRDALAGGRSEEAAGALARLLARWRTFGRFLARPPRVAIAGRPNVGKSTLLNRLVGSDRVITSPLPGTTRDWVEAPTALDGLPVVLVDTAGLRPTDEPVEREGVLRARVQAERADLVLWLLDAADGATEEDLAALAHLGGRALAVWNKADLVAQVPARPEGPAVVAETGEGLDGLRRRILDRLDYRAPPPGEAVPVAAAQVEALGAALRLIETDRTAEAVRLIERLAAEG